MCIRDSHRGEREPRFHDRAREALVGARLYVRGGRGECVRNLVLVEKSQIVHSSRRVGLRAGRADADGDEVERQIVLTESEVERREQRIPALAVLAPAREQQVWALETVAGAKAFGVVPLGDVHTGAGDLVGWERRAPVGQLML